MADVAPERLTARVVAVYPHDPKAYTQGLVWHGGELLESTGQYGSSTLRRVRPATGEVLQSVSLPADLFGEGLALIGEGEAGRLVQLTWQNGRAFVWALDTFELVDEHHYDGEGWGLCHDGKQLVMSDGSATLRFRDPRTFSVAREVDVTYLGRPVGALNELECVDGKVYANVWQTAEIVRIDPRTGAVDGVVDARALVAEVDSAAVDVLNGIAWVPERRRFLLTGKLWPLLFEVTFEAR